MLLTVIYSRSHKLFIENISGVAVDVVKHGT